MDIQFINTEEWGVDPEQFELYIRRLQKHVPKKQGILNVIFINDDYIRSLNKQYRDKDEPTDVLSFSYLGAPDFKETGLIGEVYISVPTAKRQAGDYKHPLSDELNRLFVHGVLHVFAYDHETERDYKEMKKVEDEVLKG